MAVQAEWNGFLWQIGPGLSCPISDLSTSRSVSVERNEDKEGEPATQTVAHDLITVDITYQEARVATGRDPFETYHGWWYWVGTYAPLYMHGEKFLVDLLMLKSVTPSDVILAPDGSWLSCSIQLSFEEYAEDESGLKLDKREGVLSAGQTEQTAVDVGPSASQMAGKIPANPGM